MNILRSRILRNFITYVTLAILIATGGQHSSLADEPTGKEKLEIKRIHQLILKGGRLFKARNYDASLGAVDAARQRLEKLAGQANNEVMELLKPEHARLTLAHKLLTEVGKKPAELKELPPPVPDQPNLISFKNDVAPLLVAKCGRCHVSRARGNFSAASYNALGQSTMVTVGNPDQSRLIEMIVEGEMPPGGSLLETELMTLKTWIAQGAKFDGDDPAQDLRQLVGGSVPDQSAPLKATLPTGSETVSFGLHVAPVLIKNCVQCHIETNNPRGNLNMRTFESLLRGGDSGSPLQPGISSESLIIQRLNAIDNASVMPPTGKLDDTIIAVIRTWIDEGAAFDGGDVDLETRTVAATAKADSQSHDELKADRITLARKNWKLAMPQINPETASTKSFNLFGTCSQDELEALGNIAETLVPKIQSALKSDPGEPFVKGNTAIFVFQKHYDFSEFATMIEGHSLPRGVTGNWGFSNIDAYASLMSKNGQEPTDVQVDLAWQLAAVKVSAMSPDVPRWFADGVGRWVAARMFPRDATVKSWDAKATLVISNMQQPGDFLSGKLPEHQAAVVAYLFVKQLRSDSGRFTKLLKLLREGKPFEVAFSLAYGATPKTMFGSSPNDSRRGN